jgi:ligand-binding sensor domain-containing protein
MIKKHLFFLVCLFCFWSQSQAQRFIFRNYSVEDGIAQSQVYCALQDKRGVLWFGTQGGGLTAYDGVHFKTFTEKEGLIDNTINDIKQDKKGNLWIATKKGVCIYNGLKFKKLKSKNKLDIRANKLSFDGLYWYDGNSIHAVSQENKWEATIVNTVFCDGDKIYFGTQNGLFLWDTKQRKRTAFSQKSRFMNNAITAVYKDKKGTIWIGTFGDGLYAFNGKNFYRIDWKQELYRTSVLDIYEDEEGYLWMATLQQGVLRYSPYDGLFQQLSEADGLSSRHVRTILQDNAGNFGLELQAVEYAII